MDETEHIDERSFAATVIEAQANGTGINWRYWVEHMPTLTAAQAARLMSALEPDMHNDLQLSASTDDTTKLRKKAEMLQRLAIAQGRMFDSPQGWLLWSRQHRFMPHDGFVVAVESLRPVERTPVLVAHAPAHSSVAPEAVATKVSESATPMPTGAVTTAEPPPASEPVPDVVVAAPRTKVSQAAAKEALPDDPMQRRRTCLDWFRAEDGKRPKEAGKRGKRGALQRVVEKSGIDKDTLGAMLDKAVDEKRNADAFAQLTAKR